MKKKIFYLIFVLLIGFLGGLAADLFLPYLSEIAPFSQMAIFKNLNKNSTVVINKTEQVSISENDALQKAIGKIEPTLVVVQTFRNKILISQGTGFIVTADGLIATSADFLSKKFDQCLVWQNDWQQPAEVKKIDTANDLALLKIEKNNLPVVSLVNLNDLYLGQTIALAGLKSDVKNSKTYAFVNLGTLRSIEEQTLLVNLEEKNILANGGPLFNLNGAVMGMNVVGAKGLEKTIPADKIQSFLSN